MIPVISRMKQEGEWDSMEQNQMKWIVIERGVVEFLHGEHIMSAM